MEDKEKYARWRNEENVVLTDEEKEYLQSVIKPFRDKVTFICKDGFYIDICDTLDICTEKYCLKIPCECISTKFNGMALNTHYTLEELGLKGDKIMEETKSILTNEEKEKLNKEIKHYGTNVESIINLSFPNVFTVIDNKELHKMSILLRYTDKNVILNYDNEKKLFQNMEIGKKYTLEELGL